MTIETATTADHPGLEAPAEAATASQIPSDASEPVGEHEKASDSGPNREAAKYRRQLRDAEAERDGLRAQVEALQRAEVERLATTDGHLIRPSAIWAAGVSLPDVIGEDGKVDPIKVFTAVGQAINELGLATANRSPKPDPSQGPRGGDSPGQSWTEFLKPKN